MSGTLARRAPRFVYLCDAQDLAQPSARFGWRLVAANNRPLGRAVRAETSLAHCRAAARQLHHGVVHVTRLVQFSPARGHWSWQVGIGGAAVAVCAHPYLRRLECIRALDQFLLAVQTASPDDGVVRHFGPTSLRAYAPALTTTGLGS
jgi:hypothetical protein